MTEWWAFKPISTAFEKTKKLLLEPFNAWTWLKLMVIVFFVGIGSGRIGNQFSNTMNYNTGSSDASNIRYAINSLLSNPAVITMLIIAAVLIVIVALIFAYLRNVFSFVLIRDLASGDVHVIKPMMENLGRGLRLFVFTLVAGIFTLAVVLAFIVVVVLAVLLAIKMGTASAAGIIATILAICLICLLILLMIIFCVTMGIFIGFTYDFVAPMVYFKGMGIVESWKWLWASIKKNWQQYGVYVITRWVLELGVGIVSLIILVPVSLIFIAVLVHRYHRAHRPGTPGRAGPVHPRHTGHIDAHRGVLPVLLARRAPAYRPVRRRVLGEVHASAADAAGLIFLLFYFEKALYSIRFYLYFYHWYGMGYNHM